MNSSDADRLIDTLIGEAVLSLLERAGASDNRRIAAAFRVNKEHEKGSPAAGDTLVVVIAEIGSNSIAFTRRRTAQGRTNREGPLNDNRDNVVPLFGSGKPSDPKKYIDCNLTATVSDLPPELGYNLQLVIISRLVFLHISRFASLLQIQPASGNSVMNVVDTRYNPVASH